MSGYSISKYPIPAFDDVSGTVMNGTPRTRLAYTLDEAAGQLGVSRDHFDRFIRPELRTVRRGRRVIVAHKELQRWLDASGTVI